MNIPADTDMERDLLLRLQQGDSDAFNSIYVLYQRRIAWNLLRLLKSEELVQDVMQDLFLKVWDNRRNIDPSKSFRSYLFKIAENMVYDIFRKATLDEKLFEQLMRASENSYSHIEENIFATEKQQSLHNAINLLPPQRRQVFTLCKLEEKSYKEVAELLGISHATINDHLNKANQFLRKQISAESMLSVSALATIILYRI